MRQINSAELINFTKYMMHVYMYIYNLSLFKRNLAKLKEKPEKRASPTQYLSKSTVSHLVQRQYKILCSICAAALYSLNSIQVETANNTNLA